MLCRECAELQPTSGHPEDASEWNVTKPSLRSRGGDAGSEQGRAMQRSSSRLGLSICQGCEEARCGWNRVGERARGTGWTELGTRRPGL